MGVFAGEMEGQKLDSLSRYLQVCKETQMFKITPPELPIRFTSRSHIVGLNESKMGDLNTARLQAAVLGEQSPFTLRSLERGRSFQGHLT